jgi:DNA primase large subunit
MNAPTVAPVTDEKSLPVKPALEELTAQIEDDTERTRFSLARLTSNSVDKLEGLMSEIQEMREFLRSEGERVQREIVNYTQLNQSVALAATKIKAETVDTWKSTAVAGEVHSSARQLSNGREKLKRWPTP